MAARKQKPVCALCGTDRHPFISQGKRMLCYDCMIEELVEIKDRKFRETQKLKETSYETR